MTTEAPVPASKMRLGMTVLGFAGALTSLLLPVALFGSRIAAPAGALLTDPGALRVASMAIAVIGLLGAAIQQSRPLGGSLVLFACAEAAVILLGLDGVGIPPVLLMALSGIVGLQVAQEEAGERVRPGLFGLNLSQSAAFLALVMLVTICPYMLYPIFLMRVLCAALFACAFNLLIGYVGLMSFGHAAFFGMGSYVAAWTAKNWGVSAELAILLGGLTGAALGVVFGWLAIRRQGIYFAMITLALAQMIHFFCLQAPFTGGEDGIQPVPRTRLFGLISLQSDMAMYMLVAVIFLSCFLLIHRVVHSPFGQVLKATRENEPRATSLGYRTDDYKLIAFVLSTFIAGLAGGTKALVLHIATLTDVRYEMSGEVVLMTLLGGLGTIFGPVAGAAVIIGLENYLAEFGSWVTVTQGLIFIVCVLTFRRGIVGELAAKLRISL